MVPSETVTASIASPSRTLLLPLETMPSMAVPASPASLFLTLSLPLETIPSFTVTASPASLFPITTSITSQSMEYYLIIMYRKSLLILVVKARITTPSLTLSLPLEALPSKDVPTSIASPSLTPSLPSETLPSMAVPASPASLFPVTTSITSQSMEYYLIRMYRKSLLILVVKARITTPSLTLSLPLENMPSGTVTASPASPSRNLSLPSEMVPSENVPASPKSTSINQKIQSPVHHGVLLTANQL